MQDIHKTDTNFKIIIKSVLGSTGSVTFKIKRTSYPVKLYNFTAAHEIGTEEIALPVLLCNAN